MIIDNDAAMCTLKHLIRILQDQLSCTLYTITKYYTHLHYSKTMYI